MKKLSPITIGIKLFVILITLAVRPDWNGDGNLGIWVISEGVDIYVAEGKIASQVGPYSEFEMQPTNIVIDGVKQSEKHQNDFFYIF